MLGAGIFRFVCLFVFVIAMTKCFIKGTSLEEKCASVYSSRKASVHHGREATVARACDDITSYRA